MDNEKKKQKQEKNNLKFLSKTELIELLLEQENDIAELEQRCSRAELAAVQRNVEKNSKKKKKNRKKIDKTGGYRPKKKSNDHSEDLLYVRKKTKTRKVLRLIWSIISVVIVTAAAAVLVATLFTPVMRVYGTSMEPVLKNGELLVAIKNGNFIEHGDIVAFYYNDTVLLKRAIALEGDKVAVTEEGDVYVNDNLLDEPYVSGKSMGICDVDFPMIIPENSIFVLGDHRSVSVDSRSSDIGNIKSERIVGKIVLRVWPLSEFGFID